MRRDKALQVELETLRLENARLKAAQGAQHQAAHYLHAQDSGYRLLFERNPQVMWVYDAQTLAFLAVNDAAVQHFGYSRAEFLMMTLRDLYPPEDIPTLMSVIQEPASPLTGIWR